MYQNLKRKWEAGDTTVKVGVVVLAAVIAVVFVVKILPYLVAAMGIGAFLAILFVPYWAPTIIAFARKHPSKGAVFALNFFLGWTFIGWVVALVWALSDNTARAPQSVVVHTTVNPNINVNATPPSQSAPTYRVGEIVNGHQLDGSVSMPAPDSAGRPSPTPQQ